MVDQDFVNRANSLQHYLYYNNYEEVAKIIGSYEDSKQLILYQTEDRGSALHVTAHKASLELSLLVFSELTEGEPIDLLDDNNETPLMKAVSRNEYDDEAVEIAKLFISYGADVNKHSLDGRSSLHYAMIYNQTFEMIELLLQNGANITWESWDEEYFGTPLILATKLGLSVNIIHHLLENGADANDYDIENNSCLHYASNITSYETFQTLVRFGAKCLLINHLGYSVGSTLIINWLPDVYPMEAFDFLIEHEAIDMTCVDEKQNTLLHTLFAHSYYYEEVVLYFIQNGININAVNEDGDTCLHLLAKDEVSDWKVDKMIQLLIEKGAQEDIRNHERKTYKDIIGDRKENIREPFVLLLKDEMKNDENDCPICMIEMTGDQILGKCPQCTKYFHNECLLKMSESKCPICRFCG